VLPPSSGYDTHSDVVEYQRFGGPYCLHLQVMMQCNDVVRYQRFGGPYCLHLHVVMQCSDVVEHQRFGAPCCLHLQVMIQCSIVVGYQRFGAPCCLHYTTRRHNPEDLDLIFQNSEVVVRIIFEQNLGTTHCILTRNTDLYWFNFMKWSPFSFSPLT
jgi:hypothetical protein